MLAVVESCTAAFELIRAPRWRHGGPPPGAVMLCELYYDSVKACCQSELKRQEDPRTREGERGCEIAIAARIHLYVTSSYGFCYLRRARLFAVHSGLRWHSSLLNRRRAELWLRNQPHYLPLKRSQSSVGRVACAMRSYVHMCRLFSQLTVGCGGICSHPFCGGNPGTPAIDARALC